MADENGNVVTAECANCKATFHWIAGYVVGVFQNDHIPDALPELLPGEKREEEAKMIGSHERIHQQEAPHNVRVALENLENRGYRVELNRSKLGGEEVYSALVCYSGSDHSHTRLFTGFGWDSIDRQLDAFEGGIEAGQANRRLRRAEEVLEEVWVRMEEGETFPAWLADAVQKWAKGE